MATKKKYLRGLRRTALFMLAAAAALNLLLLASLYLFPVPEKLDSGYSEVFLSERGDLLRISLSGAGTYRIRLPLEKMPDSLIKSVINYEDRYFYLHPGVNPFSAARAAFQNIKSSRRISGGSTISMQIARMLDHPGQRRTASLKLLESLRAVQLEWRYSKKQLLEFYLNSVPMGGNIEGVGAASYLYFGKPAASLTLGQCALIAGLPRSPETARPDRFLGQAVEVRDKVLSITGKRAAFSQEEVALAKQEKLPGFRFENPFKTPNLVLRASRLSDDPLKVLSFEPNLQDFCEAILKKEIKRLSKYNVHNAAMIVVENSNCAVRAYVGSADFNDHEHFGQINGANVRRSPGSLLKPFLFARGIENGKVTPCKVLFDAEVNYGGYTPGNFSRKFSGQVKARDSLVESLNVPAVNLEYELSGKGLSGFLKDSRIKRASELGKNTGLSVVLGAEPFTLEELVRFYACLANGGMMMDLQFFSGSKEQSGYRVLSEESCYIVTEMLSENERPDLPSSWEFTANRGRVAFKTGTSFGLKDAWCIGYTPDYTVGVWLGNMDCKGSGELVGIKAAAPIMIEVMNKLCRYRDRWFKRPEQVRERKVCAVSGEPSGKDCGASRTDMYVAGVSSTQVCSVHKTYYVDKRTGYQVCSGCMSSKRDIYERRVAAIWPADITAYLKQNGRVVDNIPEHDPRCAVVSTEMSVRIKSPLNNSMFVISRAVPAHAQKIALKVESRAAEEALQWYVDDVLVHSGPVKETVFVDAVNGKHTVRVHGSRGEVAVSNYCVYDE